MVVITSNGTAPSRRTFPGAFLMGCHVKSNVGRQNHSSLTPPSPNGAFGEGSHNTSNGIIGGGGAALTQHRGRGQAGLFPLLGDGLGCQSCQHLGNGCPKLPNTGKHQDLPAPGFLSQCSVPDSSEMPWKALQCCPGVETSTRESTGSRGAAGGETLGAG